MKRFDNDSIPFQICRCGTVPTFFRVDTINYDVDKSSATSVSERFNYTNFKNYEDNIATNEIEIIKK